ncbi:SGNH/GDSL hydrolase family protein [Streptococcus suis]|nr:SGNH/GDSL hydrolase family protein [Streptococcus suis]
MNSRKILQNLVVFFSSLLGFLLLFYLLIPSAQPRLMSEDFKEKSTSSLHYVALGDSLTEGVGDTTSQGGFVPLLAQSLTNEYGDEVSYENYGVSGNTSSQILKRMKKDTAIGESLKTADFMTLTVGGNDLRKAILENIANLEVSTFDKPAQEYSQRLLQIIKKARENNPDLPIYLVGIYNPFYLNFPEMTEMQTIVDNWNQVSEDAVSDLDKVYFIPINDLLYKGIEGEEGISQSDITSNNLLYEEDSFHPNNTGYEIIKEAVMEKIRETKKNW